ncbi:MAG: IPT/TIG domain-containing protein, partial [bacterium]
MYQKITIGSLLCASIIFSGCENKEPNTVWYPNPDEKPQPVIQSVEPAVSAYAGIQVITLTGQNFSPIPVENIITVKGQPGIILTASETKITAIPPLVIGDSVSLRLDVIGSYYSGEFQPYRLISPANVYGNFAADEFVQDIEFDKDGNLYALIINSVGDKI